MSKMPPVWRMVKEAIEKLGGKASYSDIRKYIKNKYGDVNDNTITCQIIICSVNHLSRIHYPQNKKPRIANSRYDFLFNAGRGQVELYVPEKHGAWEIREDKHGRLTVAQTGLDEASKREAQPEEADDESLAFPLESHLRDFIVRNIESLNINGQSLRLYVDDYDQDGIEYQTEIGPIDILTTDKEGNFVIFELKLSRGADRAVGQISRYMGWVKKNLADGKKVKGIIVARTVSEKLKYAVSVIPEVSLFEYEVSFSIRPVGLED